MNIFQLIANTTSRSAKERLLRKANDNELTVIKYAYNPLLSYGVSGHATNIDNMGKITQAGFNLLDRLAKRELSGYKAKQAVEDYAKIHGDLIKMICMKDLRCGITAVTINNVFKNFIFLFKIQKAKETPLSKVTFPCYADIKYDGVRLVITSKGGVVEIRTRSSKLVNLPKLASLFSDYNDLMLDGELTTRRGTMVDRPKISGMVNSAMHGGVIDEDDIVFHAFDVMKLSDFQVQQCDKPYLDRLQTLEFAVSGINSSMVEFARPTYVSTPEEAVILFNNVVLLKEEGLVLKRPDHYYCFKRSADWAKMKSILTADLKCTAVGVGKGQFVDKIGALYCEGLVDGITVRVSVGSGLSHAQRNYDPSVFIGKTIEIKYNGVLHDSIAKSHTLFLSRFVEVRIDK